MVSLPQVEVHFDISGDLDPNEVTRITGVVPSTSARRGARIRAADAVVPVEDRWTLRSEETSTIDGTTQVVAMVHRLRSLAKSLSLVRARFPNVAMDLTLIAYVPDQPQSAVPNLSLDSSVLREMADLGIGFAIDYMLLGSEEQRS
jgi:hypothetical protein